jgi:hypothetical protein
VLRRDALNDALVGQAIQKRFIADVTIGAMIGEECA